MNATNELALREMLVDYGRKLNGVGLTEGTSGNLSVRFGDGMLITPSGMNYETVGPDDIVYMEMSGRYEHRLQPSSEWRFHRDILAEKPEAGAVVHAHPPHCTALAARRVRIPPFHYVIALAGGPDVRCADYATYGTEELSRNALAALKGRLACLLANHGMIAVGATLPAAFKLAREVENLARQYILALSTGQEPALLSDEEIARVIEKFKTYGDNAQRKAAETQA